MFGITVADAVLVGTLVLSVLAAWRGSKDGDVAAKVRPPAPETAILGATLVDTGTFRDVAVALRELTAAIREGIEAQQDAANTKMLTLMEQIRDAMSAPPPPRRPARRRSGNGG